jgi:hypothetical protein
MVVEKNSVDRVIPMVAIGDTVLENVDDFVYLGSKETQTGDMIAEASVRKQRMLTAFNQWEGRILMNPLLSRRLRLIFFNLIVVSNGIYGCATWNLNKKQIADLEKTQFRLLKKVCGIHLDKRASYERVMAIAERAGCPVIPLECTIAKLQLRYLGHVERMGNARLQKQMLYGQLELPGGKRKRGAPARNYRLAIVDALTKFGYSTHTWREVAASRSEWRQQLNSSGKDYFTDRWLAQRDTDKRKRRARREILEAQTLNGGTTVALPIPQREVQVEGTQNPARSQLNLQVHRNRQKNIRRNARRWKLVEVIE